ncbi:unnamed protein product, partial [Laminaria digitata]
LGSSAAYSGSSLLSLRFEKPHKCRGCAAALLHARVTPEKNCAVLTRGTLGVAIRGCAFESKYFSPMGLPTSLDPIFFFFFSHPIYYLRPSVSLPPYGSRNSDPGSQSRLFLPPPHYGT